MFVRELALFVLFVLFDCLFVAERRERERSPTVSTETIRCKWRERTATTHTHTHTRARALIDTHDDVLFCSFLRLAPLLLSHRPASHQRRWWTHREREREQDRDCQSTPHIDCRERERIAINRNHQKNDQQKNGQQKNNDTTHPPHPTQSLHAKQDRLEMLRSGRFDLPSFGCA